MENLPLGIYKHYKGNLYNVLHIGTHSETLEKVVVYQALYDSPEFGKNAIWVRPLTMFLETVEYQGNVVKRFEYVRDAE